MELHGDHLPGLIRTNAVEEKNPEEPCNLQVDTQVRRIMWCIVRRKCALKGLRRMLEALPKLPEITDNLFINKDGTTFSSSATRQRPQQ